MKMIRNIAWDGPHGADMQRELLIALGGGIASAALSLGLLSGAGGLAMIAYFAPLPLFVVGFMAGARPVIVAGSFALVAMAFMGGLPAAVVYLGTIMIPSWVVVYHALSHRILSNGATGWFTPGEIASRLTALGAAFVAAITLAAMGTAGGVEASIREFLEVSFSQLMPIGDNDPGGEMIDRLVPMFPALAMLSWLAMLTINATLAQAILVKRGMALRASPHYRAIEAPEWAYWAIVAAAILKLLGTGEFEYLAQNLVMIFAAPFFFVGLAVVHSLADRLKSPATGLTIFYVLLSFMIFSWMGLLVTALGFAEQWLRLRDRYGRIARSLMPRNQSEDE
jgi:hypothetical protein